MMLQIVVEVATGTVCDAGCSIFSQTVDRQPPSQQLIEVWHVRWAEQSCPWVGSTDGLGWVGSVS